MIPLGLSSATSVVSVPSPLLSGFSPTIINPKSATRLLNQKLKTQRRFGKGRRKRLGICRAGVGAEIPQDAPFAIAIGACMLSSLLLPSPSKDEDEDEDKDAGAAIAPNDARFAVMTIIAFIPYFNWLSWVFAWMDTSSRRYAVYAAVYLAPYLRTNLSLSPDESWLPIASIVLCIIHVQLEASIRSGDIDGFTLFDEVAKHLGLTAESKDGHYRRQHTTHEGRRPNDMKLPSGKTQSRDENKKWEVNRKASKDPEHNDANDKIDE